MSLGPTTDISYVARLATVGNAYGLCEGPAVRAEDILGEGDPCVSLHLRENQYIHLRGEFDNLSVDRLRDLVVVHFHLKGTHEASDMLSLGTDMDAIYPVDQPKWVRFDGHFPGDPTDRTLTVLEALKNRASELPDHQAKNFVLDDLRWAGNSPTPDYPYVNYDVFPGLVAPWRERLNVDGYLKK